MLAFAKPAKSSFVKCRGRRQETNEADLIIGDAWGRARANEVADLRCGLRLWNVQLQSWLLLRMIEKMDEFQMVSICFIHEVHFLRRDPRGGGDKQTIRSAWVGLFSCAAFRWRGSACQLLRMLGVGFARARSSLGSREKRFIFVRWHLSLSPSISLGQFLRFP